LVAAKNRNRAGNVEGVLRPCVFFAFGAVKLFRNVAMMSVRLATRKCTPSHIVNTAVSSSEFRRKMFTGIDLQGFLYSDPHKRLCMIPDTSK
jgi:hypothetical protein